jgi:hypothetical protein
MRCLSLLKNDKLSRNCRAVLVGNAYVKVRICHLTVIDDKHNSNGHTLHQHKAEQIEQYSMYTL